MAKAEKHKKNPLVEWMAEEESDLGAHARSPRIVGGGKTQKVGSRKAAVTTLANEKADPALLLREPGPLPRLEERHSPAGSPEHLRKLQRLPRLRAPVTYPLGGHRPR